MDFLKRQISDLAIFGGDKLFEPPRPIGQLWVPKRESFYGYCDYLFSGADNGKELDPILLLEDRLKSVHQVKHCIAYANASVAIVALLKLMGSYYGKEHGEVVLPAFTYSGLPHLVRWAGFMPKFVDVEQKTQAISPQAVRESLGPDTVAILAVHQINSPADVTEFAQISSENDLPVIYDSVHGILCSIDGVPVGNFGEAEIFSLHATKIINGFEGGYVTTNSEKIATDLRAVRSYGEDPGHDWISFGLNGHLNPVHAALALASLEDKDQIIALNRSKYEKYAREFESVPQVSWVKYDQHSSHGQKYDFNYEFFILEIPQDWPLSRDQVVMLLRSEGGLARGYYSPPVHHSSHFPIELEVPSLPVTEELSERFVQMPVGDCLSLRDIEVLATWFTFIHQNAEAIKIRLNEMVEN
ncbi:MAG: DegT/DnrJ/EryC1/StrS family aminotransferase [Bdellovibrionales bacterium]|nr:DegT/DnrJ/EryC1/StrS family aminotransferase [Bdellovibrionales bacterium]